MNRYLFKIKNMEKEHEFVVMAEETGTDNRWLAIFHAYSEQGLREHLEREQNFSDWTSNDGEDMAEWNQTLKLWEKCR